MDIVYKIKKWLNESMTNKIIGLTTLVFLIQLIVPQSFYLLALFPIESEHFKITQYLTAVFSHGGIIHITFNMIMLHIFGKSFEKNFGSKKLLYFYLITGIGSNLITHLIPYLLPTIPLPSLGASGAIFGLLIIYGIMFPNRLIYIMFIPFGIKARYLIGGYIILEFLLYINGTSDGINHLSHLSGSLIGYVYYTLSLKRNTYNPSVIRSRYMKPRPKHRR